MEIDKQEQSFIEFKEKEEDIYFEQLQEEEQEEDVYEVYDFEEDVKKYIEKEKTRSKENNKNNIYKSFFINNKFIAEQIIYQRENGFAVYNIITSEIKFIKSFQLEDGKKYLPNFGEEIKEGYIKL
ncbi:MAG: hypothetical protein V1663_01030, partial [archaeon]